MKHLIMIIIAFPILIMGCSETCDTQPEISFKPVDEQGKAIVATNGIYNADSLKLLYQSVQGNDTSYVDNTNMSSFQQSDSVFFIHTSSQGEDIFLLRYSSNDIDTLTFDITENKKRQPMCVDITFTYNGVEICNKCDLNAIHNVIKK